MEELCPGGLDATDQISLAKKMIEAGASAIMASGGCSDFLPLKNRRQTQHKNDKNWSSWPEPWLCSAHWLLGEVEVPVFAQGAASQVQNVMTSAKHLGFAGIIDTSVKDPSSLMSMAKQNLPANKT
jgi:hypothetical protein